MEKSAVNYALKCLERQPQSTVKLQQKLLTKGFGESEVVECMESLKKWGYLNDVLYAADRITLLKSRLKSRRFACMDLVNNGIDEKTAEQTVAQKYLEDEEQKIIEKILLKRRKNDVSSNWKYLMGLGFAEELLERCFNERYPT